MKKSLLNVLCVSTVLMAISALFTACSNDDDENSGGSSSSANVKTCYAIADNKKTTFKYAYLLEDISEKEDDEYLYCFIFFDPDIFYYYNHPEKITDDMAISYAMIEFYSAAEYDINNLPLGDFIDEGDKHFFELAVNTSLKSWIEDTEENLPNELWYTNDWTPGITSSPISISRTSGGSYKIQITNLKLLSSELGGSSIDGSARKTTGSFYFEGIPEVVDGNDYGYNRSVSTSKTHQRTKEFLMRLVSK